MMTGSALVDGIWKSYYADMPHTIWNGVENTVYLLVYWYGFWMWTKGLQENKQNQ